MLLLLYQWVNGSPWLPSERVSVPLSPPSIKMNLLSSILNTSSLGALEGGTRAERGGTSRAELWLLGMEGNVLKVTGPLVAVRPHWIVV